MCQSARSFLILTYICFQQSEGETMISMEEMCRQLLLIAVGDGLVVMTEGHQPEELSSGDLVGMANRLSELLNGDGVRTTQDAPKVITVDTTSAFDPVAFLGEDWSFAEDRNPRSAMLGLLDDYSKVKLTTDWLEGKSSVDGETRRTRIPADTASTPLHADHFLDLWNNKQKIPEEWKSVKGVITFDGDILRGPSDRRFILYLCWNGGKWHWNYSWLDRDWNAYNPSAVFAS
jgi:hypothetical protein